MTRVVAGVVGVVEVGCFVVLALAAAELARQVAVAAVRTARRRRRPAEITEPPEAVTVLGAWRPVFDQEKELDHA